ncbi:MAG: prenyltransferase [Thiohalobacterales bacterium]|nr:prenyltransferase [Thiohalobacterales bacterium]
MQKVATIIRSTRPAFLLLTPVCVFLGASTAVADGYRIEPRLFLLALAGALLAHISVNTLNEYYDYRSGLDLHTRRTPFSGGSGALPARPHMLNAVFATGLVALMASMLIGVYFAWLLGPGIIPLGILGAVLIVTYTEWLNRSPLLCLIAPGLGFGLLMVAGTGFVLTGDYTLRAWIAGLVPFFLVNNLLLLNQYPDTAADRQAGRRHFPVVYGTRQSSTVYGLFLLAAATSIVLGVTTGQLPLPSLLALLPLIPALHALRGAIRHGADIGTYPQYLGANVVTTLLAPLLLGITIIFG